jgi:hypothetical protein
MVTRLIPKLSYIIPIHKILNMVTRLIPKLSIKFLSNLKLERNQIYNNNLFATRLSYSQSSSSKCCLRFDMKCLGNVSKFCVLCDHSIHFLSHPRKLEHSSASNSNIWFSSLLHLCLCHRVGQNGKYYIAKQHLLWQSYYHYRIRRRRR